MKRFERLKSEEEISEESTANYEKTTYFSNCEYSEEQKRWIKYIMHERSRELNSMYVIYHCTQCKEKKDVLLDRYPMSPKIISSCNHCDNHLIEISDPIKFYLPLTKQEFDQKDLAEMHITDSPQSDLLCAYSITGFIDRIESKIKEIEEG